MTKVVKKKAKKLKLLNFSFTLFIILFVAFICSSTLLRSYNVALSTQLTKINAEITELSKEKETLQLEVNELSSYDRVTAIVGDELSYDSSNFVTVVESENEEE